MLRILDQFDYPLSYSCCANVNFFKINELSGGIYEHRKSAVLHRAAVGFFDATRVAYSAKSN